jgi:integrin beta 3
MPKPVDGKDGAPGRDGVSPTPEDIVPIVKAVTTDILAEWPRPVDGAPGKDGTHGNDGAPGEPGERGEQGEPGLDGKDGRDGQPGVPGRDGKDGAMGLNGKDGKDGLTLNDLEVEQIDDRSLRITLASGEIVKAVEWKMPVPIYRGAFSAEKTFERGDEVNFGGQVYIAVKDAPQGRPGTSEDWQMRTRRGRDGRDGAQGSPGERGPQGPRGRDQWEKP